METGSGLRNTSAMAPEGRTILVVDDDADARESLRALLVELNFDVVEAEDGEAAIHYLTSKRGDPALIVTDLAMPDMTGWEFINVLQAYVRLASIPVLVVSGVGLNDRPVREEATLEFFSKPLDTDRFLASVQRHALTADRREAKRGAAAKKLAHSPF